jgi:hypothetical protein
MAITVQTRTLANGIRVKVVSADEEYVQVLVALPGTDDWQDATKETLLPAPQTITPLVVKLVARLLSRKLFANMETIWMAGLDGKAVFDARFGALLSYYLSHVSAEVWDLFENFGVKPEAERKAILAKAKQMAEG